MQTPESDYGTMRLDGIPQEGKAQPAAYKISGAGQDRIGMIFCEETPYPVVRDAVYMA
jgi:hypothetical protein